MAEAQRCRQQNSYKNSAAFNANVAPSLPEKEDDLNIFENVSVQPGFGQKMDGFAEEKSRHFSWKSIKNFLCNIFETEEMDYSDSTFENGTDAVKAICNSTGHQTASLKLKNDARGDGSKITTLKDSLRKFKFWDRLQLLEESLERVRRHRNNQVAMESHNSIIQQLDKDMLQLSKKYHPDKVQSRKGSEEEVLHAQKMQTALNATRKVMNILNKIFLEDIDIDHKYGFYTNLEISSLGNEDEIEGHVFDILFKISLISEIKQRHIIAEIGKFLTVSQSCLQSYVQCEGNVLDFDKHLSSALFHLKQCIRGYNKLHRELGEIEEECKAENPDNIYSLIKKMRYNCSLQLNHLQKLLTITDLCSKESFGIFTCPEELDDYFVLPFVSYINILLMCNVFQKRDEKGKSKKIKIVSDTVFNGQTMFLAPAYYLTSYYGGSKLHENEVLKSLGKELIDPSSVKEKFLDILSKRNDDLKDEFKVDEYSVSGSNSHITKELKKCKEMMSEFEQKKKDLVRDIADAKKETKTLNQQIDKIISDQEESRKQCEAHLAENSGFQTKFEHFLTNIKDFNQQPEKMQGMRDEYLKEYEACVAKHAEIQAKFASTSVNDEIGDQEMVTKTMSKQEERRKQCEAVLAKNSEIQARFANTTETFEIEHQQPRKTVSKQEHRQIYEVCLPKNSELQASCSHIIKNPEMIHEFEQKMKDVARDIADVKKETKEMNQQIDKIIRDQEESRKQCEASFEKNSDREMTFQFFIPNVKDWNHKSEKMKGNKGERRKEYGLCMS